MPIARCPSHPESYARNCMSCWVEEIQARYSCSRDEAVNIIEDIIFDGSPQ